MGHLVENYTVKHHKFHTHPMEGHWKFQGVGVLRRQNFRSKVWSLTGTSKGEGLQNKRTFLEGKYGYFRELYIKGNRGLSKVFLQ